MRKRKIGGTIGAWLAILLPVLALALTGCGGDGGGSTAVSGNVDFTATTAKSVAALTGTPTLTIMDLSGTTVATPTLTAVSGSTTQYTYTVNLPTGKDYVFKVTWGGQVLKGLLDSALLNAASPSLDINEFSTAAVMVIEQKLSVEPGALGTSSISSQATLSGTIAALKPNKLLYTIKTDTTSTYADLVNVITSALTAGKDPATDEGAIIAASSAASAYPYPMLGSTLSGTSTHDNATGVYWNKKLWLFYSTEDGTKNEIHYKTFDGSKLTNGDTYNLGTDNKDTINSKALTNPIVVKNILYLFYTGTNNRMYYTYLDPTTDKWSNHRLPDNFTVVNNARYTAVYNTLRSWIEIYWVGETNNNIYYSRCNVDKNGLLTGNWRDAARIITGSATGSKHLSAVFNQTGDTTGLTYLAWVESVDGKRHTKVSRIQYDDSGTPKILKTDDMLLDMPGDGSDGVSLVDLGEDQMVLLHKRASSSTEIGTTYYDKKKAQWVSGSPIEVESMNNWMPTGVVFYKPTADNTATPDQQGNRNRYDAILYVMYGTWANFTHLSSSWNISSVNQNVGYWKPVSSTTMDTNNTTYSPFWQVLGVVDAPPYVMNGVDINNWCISGADCTKTAFEVTVGAQEVLGGSVKGGPYMESGSHSPVTFELSAGLSGAYESGTSYSYTRTDYIEETAESTGFIYYLAPKYVTYDLQWYDNKGKATDTHTYYVAISGTPAVRKAPFTVAEGVAGYDTTRPFIAIPNHHSTNDYNRLLTYDYTGTATDPSKHTSLFPTTSTTTWGAGTPTDLAWQVTSDTSTTASAYVSLKVGAEFKKMLGVGVEGEFEIQTTSSVKKDVKVTMAFANPDPHDPKISGDISQFDITAYWLKGDTNAYWVPTDRKGLGDTPFFITYSVNKNTIVRKE